MNNDIVINDNFTIKRNSNIEYTYYFNIKSKYKNYYIENLKKIENLNFVDIDTLYIYFNDENNKIKFIKSNFSIFIFNNILPNLKKITCQDAIINTYQPLEEINITKYYYKNKIINNLDDILIKCPKLKNISVNFWNNAHKLNIIYKPINNIWIVDIKCHLFFRKKIPKIYLFPSFQNMNNLNINANYYILMFNNIKNLIINKTITIIPLILINNVENIIIKYTFKIAFYSLDNIKSIKIIKEFDFNTINNKNTNIITENKFYFIDTNKSEYINKSLMEFNINNLIQTGKFKLINDNMFYYHLVKNENK